jgi:hypothetical protein
LAKPDLINDDWTMKNRTTVMLSSFALALLLASPHSAGKAQDRIRRPPLRVPEVVDSVSQFVPPGWRFEGVPLEVDLNGDGRSDAAFVVTNV